MSSFHLKNICRLNNWRWKEESTVLTFYDFQFLVTRFYCVNTSKSSVNNSANEEETNHVTSSARIKRELCDSSSWRGKL